MIQVISLDTISTKLNVPNAFKSFETKMEPVRELVYTDKKKEHKDQIIASRDQNDYILVKNDYKLIKLQVKDILYIEGKGNYVSLKTGKTKILTHQTMKKLEEFLIPYQFVRIHKSFIVSFQHIDSIDKHAVYINETELPISDSYQDCFRKFLAENATQI